MASQQAHAAIVSEGEELWFLGTFARIKLDGVQTGGRLGVVEVVLPRGAAPPLHSHPQDETIYVIEGELTAWVLDRTPADGDVSWVTESAQRCGPGGVLYAPGGVPHTFRVESGTARVLTLSSPAGIEGFMRALAEPARWPWLQPPPDGPRVSAERLAEAEREHGMVRHGPSPAAVSATG
jgi:uncharacterized RmlC-like cupin family protein